MMWQTGEDFFYLDAGQNVSHDDLFATVLWEILTEFWERKRNTVKNSTIACLQFCSI